MLDNVTTFKYNKNMNHLILTGCSLAEQWKSIFDHEHYTGMLKKDYPPHPFRLQADRIVNYTMGGGGNAIALHSLLNEFLLHSDDIKNMRIVCQLTGINRRSIVIKDDNKGQGVVVKNAISDNLEKIITWGSHLDLLYGTEKILSKNISDQLQGEFDDSTMRDLTSVLCMLGSLGAEVYVFRGWEGCMPLPMWERIAEQLNSHNVITYKSTYMDIAISKSLENPEYKWNDEFHPDGILAMHSVTYLLNEMVKDEKLKFTNFEK